MEKARGKWAAYKTEQSGASLDEIVYPFLFNSFVPVPEEILAAGYSWGGYYWQVNNWGTKWDLDEGVDIQQYEDGVTVISFDTAWSPPDKWLEKVASMYPPLDFKLNYFEPGIHFAGSNNL